MRVVAVEIVEDLDQFIANVSACSLSDYEAPLGRNGWLIRWVGKAYEEVEIGESQWRKDPTSRMEVQGRMVFVKHLAREEGDQDLLRATAQQLIAQADEDQQRQEQSARSFELNAVFALENVARRFATTGREDSGLHSLIRYSHRTLNLDLDTVRAALERPLVEHSGGHLAKINGADWLIAHAAEWVNGAMSVFDDPASRFMQNDPDDALLSRDLLEEGRRSREADKEMQLLLEDMAAIDHLTVRRDERILRCLRLGYSQKEVALKTGLSQSRISVISRSVGLASRSGMKP